MYKLVIFDLDGTLADTIESMATAGNKTLISLGLKPREIKEYQYFVGNGSDTLIKRALSAAGDEEHVNFLKAKEIYGTYFEEHCTYKIKLYEGIKEMLDFLKSKGIKIAVLTNKAHDRALTVIDELVGKDYFDLIIGQQPSFGIKPNPEGALYIAKELQIEPSQCLFVGDTDVDMMTGNNANMYTVGVLWGFRTRNELEEHKANKIIEHPMQLCELF